jgi:hypothetical protein
LLRANGIYEKHGNVKEAERVVEIVRELLQEESPPSIGIACLNLVQRYLILDKLEEAAAADPLFQERYEKARQRRGSGLFEGLFVKTLENIQGEERDHVIISTTFGPEPDGSFQSHFGAISQAGGGRWLNVLITRAREKVHLVTSIPRSEYEALPERDSEKPPTGAWLLCAYLKYAEELRQTFQDTAPRKPTDVTSPLGTIQVHPTRYWSSLAVSLGGRMARIHGQHCEAHWGNDGFCVDLALQNPGRPGELALGVLCDMCRFDQVKDLVEWDLFRVAMLEACGWRLHRVWSPGLFMDSARYERAIHQAVDEAVRRNVPANQSGRD